MMNTLKRLDVLAAVRGIRFNTSLLREFSVDTLLAATEIIQKESLDPSWCANYPNIQRTLIQDICFAEPLRQIMTKHNMSGELDRLIGTLAIRGLSILDYAPEHVVRTFQMPQPFKDNDRLAYLLYFGNLGELTDSQQNHLAKNIRDINSIDSTFWGDHPLACKLLKEPYISRSCFAFEQRYTEVCALIAENPELQALMRFLYEHVSGYRLKLEHLNNVLPNCEEVVTTLQAIALSLEDDEDDMLGQFIDQWLGNGAASFDVQTLQRRLSAMPREQVAAGLVSRGAYISLLYGDSLLDIDYASLGTAHETLLIYAVIHRKKRFVKLIADAFDTYQYIGKGSCLLTPSFHTTYVNLNTVDASDLAFFSRMAATQWDYRSLQPMVYTCKELRAMYGLPEQYMKLYNHLLGEPVDRRLLLLRQLAKHRALHMVTEDARIECVAKRLLEKPLSAWMQEDFGHIDGLRHRHAVALLCVYPLIRQLVPTMTNTADIGVVTKNPENASGYADMHAVKQNLTTIDAAWARLKEALGLEDAFVQKYSDGIMSFIGKNGTDIVWTYYRNIVGSDHREEAVRRLVMAELMGEFHKLKYHGGDLRRELEYPITDKMIGSWVQNLSFSQDVFDIRECDDFLGTMQVGEQPTWTCMSYVNGTYKECLLACFDSNKKLLYVSKNGRVVGRAMIRLTKGSYGKVENRGRNRTSLEFVDLADDADSKPQEQLTLFLERFYVSGLSPDETRTVVRMMLSMAGSKADALDCTLMTCDDYADYFEEGEFARTKYHMYISRSKSGVQYLDSLGGQATISDEGTYKEYSFYERVALGTVIQESMI